MIRSNILTSSRLVKWCHATVAYDVSNHICPMSGVRVSGTFCGWTTVCQGSPKPNSLSLRKPLSLRCWVIVSNQDMRHWLSKSTGHIDWYNADWSVVAYACSLFLLYTCVFPTCIPFSGLWVYIPCQLSMTSYHSSVLYVTDSGILIVSAYSFRTREAGDFMWISSAGLFYVRCQCRWVDRAHSIV